MEDLVSGSIMEVEKPRAVEITYFCYDEGVSSITAGVFPSKGRYFTKQLESKDGRFYHASISVPSGRSFYQLFANGDFSRPLNPLDVVDAPDSANPKIAIEQSTHLFCPIIFDREDRTFVPKSDGNVELRIATVHHSIQKVCCLNEALELIPFEKTFISETKVYWAAQLKESFLEHRFVFQVIQNHSVQYFHFNNQFDNWPHFPDGFRLIKNEHLTQTEFSPAKLGYQIFPDRFSRNSKAEEREFLLSWLSPPEHYSYFGGTIQGIIEKLAHIKSLGVDIIYLNPIFHSKSSHRYDTIDYLSVDPILGREEDFARLVETAHALEMKVILDLALNHCSTMFFAFEEVLRLQEDSQYLDWFDIHSFPVVEVDNPAYSCWHGRKEYPQFNMESEEVMSYFKKVSAYWIKTFDIDGWRLDSCADLSDNFLERFISYSRSLKPDLIIMAEVWSNDLSLQQLGVNGITNYGLYWNVLLPFFKGSGSVSLMASNIMKHYYEYPVANHNLSWNFFSNHDIERFYTAINHKHYYQLAIALLFWLPGIPIIYYGEEVEMEGAGDPDNRRCMDWSKIDHSPDTFEWIKKLQAVRSDYNGYFTNGCLSIASTPLEANVLVVSRNLSTKQQLHCLLNFSDEDQCISFSDFTSMGELVNLLDNCIEKHQLKLSPSSCTILKTL